MPKYLIEIILIVDTKNPEVAIEVQISGNIDSAIIKLREASALTGKKQKYIQNKSTKP